MNFGNIPDPIDKRDYPFVRHETTLQIPMQFDLQAYFGDPFNQDDGTDTECAVCSVVEYLTRRQGRNFERLDTTWVSRKTSSKCIRDCLNVAVNGIVPVSKKDDKQADFIAQQYKITQYERIPDINGVLEAISQWQPVIIGIKLFSSFGGAWKDIPVPKDGEQQTFNAAVVAVGFDQYTRKLTVILPLGTDVGIHGHFYLPFDYEPYIYDMWTVS